MRKAFKNLLFIFILFVISVYYSTNVYAASATTTFGTGKYTRSVRRIAWWMSYDNGGGVDIGIPVSQNYVFTRIYLNDSALHTNHTADQIKGTIIHEIGHTLGLKHNDNNIYSIMYPNAWAVQVTTVQKTDNDAIVKFYR